MTERESGGKPIGDRSSHPGGTNPDSWREWLLWTLPRGDTLPERAWRARHRAVLWVLFLHVPALFAFGYFGGTDTIFTKAAYESYSPVQTAIETGVIALFGVLAAWPRLSRRLRGASASLGLITASAVLVQFSGGYIEAHFHFFVVIALLALYEDWIPFLFGVGYVLIHHGTVGTIAPGTVYNHPVAIAYPWRWATVHALFITGLCASLIVTWRMSEDERASRRRVLAAAGDGILGFDAGGEITYANPGAADLLGVEAGSLEGEPLEEVLAWAEPLPEEHPLDVLDGEERSSPDARLETAEGETVPVEWTCRPVDERGRVTGGVLTVKDLTEQRRIQAEVRSYARRLERNNEELRQFNQAVSHDLKEPLRTVSSYCQLIEERYEDALDEEGREFLEYAAGGADRMRDLLDGLQSFLELERGDATFEEVDLDDLVDSTLQSLDARIEETDATVTVEDLPTIEGVPSQLSQLFQNLVSNALKFSGDEPPTVRIRAREEPDTWTITVEDEGVGMDPDDKEEAFRMFSRLSPSDGPGGRGVGLAICKGVVNRHGGTIDVDSKPGEGTRFIIELPKEARPRPEEDSLPPAAEGPRAS